MWEHVQNQDVFHWLSRNKLVFYRPPFNRYCLSGRMVIANSSSSRSSKEVRALYFWMFSPTCFKPQNTAERRHAWNPKTPQNVVMLETPKYRRTSSAFSSSYASITLSAADAINIVTICLTNIQSDWAIADLVISSLSWFPMATTIFIGSLVSFIYPCPSAICMIYNHSNLATESQLSTTMQMRMSLINTPLGTDIVRIYITG